MLINPYKMKITIIGGGGHIGLPLGILFANKGINVTLYDKNYKAVKKINKSQLPFIEDKGEELLRKNKKEFMQLLTKIVFLNQNVVIVCIGTPVKNNKTGFVLFF